MDNKHARYYRRSVFRLLPCARRQKRHILSGFDAALNDYIGAHPNADYAELQAHFGSPETVAASYVESAGAAELLRSLNTRRRVTAWIVTALTLMLVSWVGLVTWGAVKMQREPGYYTLSDPIELPEDTIIINGADTVTTVEAEGGHE